MIVTPNIRGFICTTAHPKGCFENVKKQIEYIKSKPKINSCENALIIGASTGYGLSSRIACAFLKKCPTIGIIFEKPPRKNKTATAGWYNTAAFELACKEDEIYSKTLNNL